MKQEAKRSYRIGGRPSTARGAGRPTPSSLSLAALLGIAGAAMGCAGTEPESAPLPSEVTIDHAEPVGEAQAALQAPPVCVNIQRGLGTSKVSETFVGLEKPNNNYGASVVALTTGSALTQRALFKWDLSAIPSDATVSSATFTLTQANTGPANPRVHKVNTPWLEGTVTWNSFGAGYDAAVLANLSNASAAISFNLVALVQSWVSGASPNHGILVEQAAVSTTKFYSSEWGVAASRPKLRVCYQVTCDATHADCDGDGTNGCETDLSSPLSCGGCGVVCPALPNAAAGCDAGVCGLGACDEGWGDCNGDPADGCETDLSVDGNCGACGVSCDDGNVCNGEESCQAAACAAGAPLSCDDGVDCTVDSCDPGSGCANDASSCASCSDGIQNGGEQGVDCGGPCPSPCVSASCTDGIQNQDETGVDCGGTSCDACPNFPGQFDDFDVTSDGKVVAISTSWSGTVTGTCFAANGTLLKSFVIAQHPQGGLVMGTSSVSTSRTTGGSIFAWYAGDWSSKLLTMRVYDGSCDPVGPAFSPSAGPSDFFVYDTVADDAGHFAVMHADPAGAYPAANAYLRFYDGAGNPMGQPLLASSNGLCHGHYGMQVSVNRTTGAGIVTCQRHMFDPIYYRRFDAAHQWIDGAFVVIPETTNGHSSWYVSHQTGVDDANNVVFEWQDYSDNTFKANFYDPGMSLVSSIVLGPTAPGAWGWDAFRHYGSRVPLYDRDFVLRDEGLRTIYRRYTTGGAMLSCGVAFKDSSPIRIDEQEHIFTKNGQGIFRDDISLAGGCVIPTCTDGIKNGDEKGLDCGGVFCAPCATCSDGVQNGDEAGVDCGGTKCGPCAAPSCNDAKHNGMETGVDCGGACAPCAPPTCAGATCSFDLGDLGQVVDYDVAGDGSAFYLSSHWQPSGATWLSVSCARPDGSLIRSKVALEGYAPNAWDGIYAQVVTSRVSKHTLISWLGLGWPNDYETRTFRGQVFDGNCNPVTQAFDWPQGPSGNYVADTAIDDAGNFALLYQDSNYVDAWVQLYGANGAPDGAPLHVDDANKCSGNYGIHVAMSRTTGAGVVTCQQHQWDPVRYRRFDAAHQWIDGALVDIDESANNQSSWYESHQLGMADDGAWVVEWQNETTDDYRANFYAPTGALLNSVVVDQSPGWAIDGFRQTNQKVRLLGADFVLRGNNQGPTVSLFRYTTSGNLIGSASLASGNIHHRYDAQGNTYTLQGSLLKNAFGL